MGDGILGYTQDPAVQQAIAGEAEGIDFDLCCLTNVNESDVAIRDRGFDLERGIGGHDDGQLLGRCHNAAYGMDRELLDNAIDRSSQKLKFRSPLCPLEIVAKPGSFALRLSEFRK